jgi:antitoxin component of RelBE/YafQ-DinJ toxin-antitoxin module
MRTTLTLDDDVSAMLEKMRRTKGLPLKQIVNEAIRAGLGQSTKPERRRHKFKTRSADLGRCLISSLDDISEALATGEGEAFQ